MDFNPDPTKEKTEVELTEASSMYSLPALTAGADASSKFLENIEKETLHRDFQKSGPLKQIMTWGGLLVPILMLGKFGIIALFGHFNWLEFWINMFGTSMVGAFFFVAAQVFPEFNEASRRSHKALSRFYRTQSPLELTVAVESYYNRKVKFERVLIQTSPTEVETFIIVFKEHFFIKTPSEPIKARVRLQKDLPMCVVEYPGNRLWCLRLEQDPSNSKSK